MKEANFSPWPIIRWGLVVVIYGATVGIAWDQMKSAREEKERISNELKTSKEAIRVAQSSAKRAQAELAEKNQKMQEMVAAFEASSQANKNLTNVMQRRIELLEARHALSEATLTSSVQRQIVTPAAAISPAAKVNIPRWLPEAPAIVVRKIKARAMREHGNDFSSAKYEIEWQTEAHEKLVRYHRMNNPTVNDVLSKAAFEKGEDFRSMVWEVERQLEAAKVIQGR